MSRRDAARQFQGNLKAPENAVDLNSTRTSCNAIFNSYWCIRSQTPIPTAYATKHALQLHRLIEHLKDGRPESEEQALCAVIWRCIEIANRPAASLHIVASAGGQRMFRSGIVQRVQALVRAALLSGLKVHWILQPTLLRGWVISHRGTQRVLHAKLATRACIDSRGEEGCATSARRVFNNC